MSAGQDPPFLVFFESIVLMLRRFLHAVNAIFCGHIVVRLGSVVLVPLFLKYWSASLYGEYLALFATVSYLTSLDIGMQQAVVNRLTQAYARDDFEDYRAVQNTALAFYVSLSVSVTFAVAMFVWLLPVPQWIGLKLTKPNIATLVIVLLTSYVMWSMPVRLISSIYQTMGDMARSQWLANAQLLLAMLLSAVVLVAGGGMLAIAFVQLLTIVPLVAFVLLDVHRRLPEFFPSLANAKFSVFKDLGHPSLLFALLLLGNLIAYQGSVLVVSVAMGGLAVAVLSMSKAIIDVIRQALYSITLALCPQFARMEALGDFEGLRVVHRVTVAATSVITLALVACAWYEGAQIITVWTRGRIEPDVMLLRLFLVLLAFQTPWAASSTVATAINRHQVQAVGYFLSAVVGLGIVMALVPFLGTWAVPLGLTLGEALGCYHFVIKATCQIIGEPYGAFAFRFWLGFATVATATLGAAFAIHSMLPRLMLLRWIVMASFTLVVATAAGLMALLTRDDRELLFSRLRPFVDSLRPAAWPRRYPKQCPVLAHEEIPMNAEVTFPRQMGN